MQPLSSPPNRPLHFILVLSGFKPTSTDSNNDRLLRPIIISILGRIGHADVICRAQTAFQSHYAAVVSAPGDEDAANQSERISPDLRAAIYSICMRNGGVEEFKTFGGELVWVVEGF